MPAPAKRALRFVRALLAGGTATQAGDVYRATSPGGTLTLPATEVQALASHGIVALEGMVCRPRPEALQWLKRGLLDADAFAAQHRIEGKDVNDVTINLAESPLARLAVAAAGEAAPFLARHQVEAGERLRRLAERARLQPRVTMSYSAAHVAGGKGAGHAAEISDMAADARRAVAELYRLLPRDCADVVLDVCGLLKGLQQIETERGWPRRSAKLVLRIGLDRLAEIWGIGDVAVGRETRRARAWRDGKRPEMF